MSPTLPPGLQAPRPARRASERPTPSADPIPRAEGLRADQWFYLLDGAQRGPIDVEDLVDLVLTSIPESTKVWHPGLEGWVRANQVRQIADEIPPPVPIPGLGARLRRRGHARLQHRAADAAHGADRGRGRGVPQVPRDAARRAGLHDLRGRRRRGGLAARRAEPALDDPGRHLDARGGRLRVLPPRAQPPDARRGCRCSSSRARTSTRSATARSRSAPTTSSRRTCRCASC